MQNLAMDFFLRQQVCHNHGIWGLADSRRWIPKAGSIFP